MRSSLNKGQTIPASELGLPDQDAHPELSSDAVYRILAAQARRGRAIGAVLFVIGAVGIFTAVVIYHSTAWAVICAIGAGAFGVWANLSEQKVRLAYIIGNKPRIVYWAHPRRSTVPGYEVFLTLHSRTGHSLEVAMSTEQLLKTVAWLRRQNTEIKCGAYDDESESSNERND